MTDYISDFFVKKCLNINVIVVTRCAPPRVTRGQTRSTSQCCALNTLLYLPGRKQCQIWLHNMLRGAEERLLL